jgi:dihydrofolate reductase
VPALKCSVYIAVSADGFIARKDNGLDWLSIVEAQGEDYGFASFMGSVDTLLMGRNTYDVALGFGAWPYAGKRVVVLTHRPAQPRHDETFASGSPAELVARLAADGSKRVYLDGGHLIRQFLAAGLVNDMTLSIIPILLGEGIPLFGAGVRESRLSLVESRSFPTGLVQLSYALG